MGMMCVWWSMAFVAVFDSGGRQGGEGSGARIWSTARRKILAREGIIEKRYKNST